MLCALCVGSRLGSTHRQWQGGAAQLSTATLNDLWEGRRGWEGSRAVAEAVAGEDGRWGLSVAEMGGCTQAVGGEGNHWHDDWQQELHGGERILLRSLVSRLRHK